MDLVTRGQAYCKIFPSVGALLLLFVKIKNKGGEEGYIYISKEKWRNFFFFFFGGGSCDSRETGEEEGSGRMILYIIIK